MEIKIHNKKTVLFIITFAIVLFWGLNHLPVIRDGIFVILGVLSPFLLGAAIAFILNVPMRFFERQLGKLIKEKKKLVRVLAILLSLVLAGGILIFVLLTVIPELVDTVVALNNGIPALLGKLDVWIKNLTKSYPELTDYLGTIKIDWNNVTSLVVDVLKNGVTNVLSSTLDIATSVVGVLTNLCIGIIFSIYILAQKEKLGFQFRKLIYAYMPQRHADRLFEIGRLTHRTFSGFISGQCLEAVIFGLLCYGGMLLCRFPYAVSVSVLIGFTTLIPVLGAFLGTALGALLIFVSSPLQAFWFVVMIIVLQQIDENLIYPRVVGNSVGLASIWVIVAVTVGGSLMGVLGMLIFVPLASVLYALLRDSVNGRLAVKEIPDEHIAGPPPEEKQKSRYFPKKRVKDEKSRYFLKKRPEDKSDGE